MLILLVGINILVLKRLSLVIDQHESLFRAVHTGEEITNNMERLLENSTNELVNAISEQDQILLASLLAEKTEIIVQNTDTEQEKALEIAGWIVADISNWRGAGQNKLIGFSRRSGFCGFRSRLFVSMLGFQNIRGSEFGLFDFAGGHEAAQVYYDGQWHYFDVTYAGVFMDEDNVLSWEQIINDPEQAVGGLRVFEENLDLETSGAGDDMVGCPRVDNIERMNSRYSVDALRNARSYGFHGDLINEVMLYPHINWEQHDGSIALGEINGYEWDVETDGRRYISGLPYTLGTYNGPRFHTTWEFSNCQIGGEYVIRYYLYGASYPDLEYWARSDDAEMLSGERFVSNAELVGGSGTVWEIRYRAEEEDCTVVVGYDFIEKQHQVLVDKIELGIIP